MKVEVEAYLRLARNDLGSAKTLMLGYPGNAAFFVQQAAEKLIKAILTHEAIRIRARHHQLGPMIDQLPAGHRWIEDLRALEWLSAAASMFRYPTADGSLPDPPDSDRYVATIAQIEKLLDRIETWLRSA